MSNCQFCGYELEAGSAFCWSCGKSDPLKGSKKQSGSKGMGKGGKIALIVSGIVLALGLAIGAIAFGITTLLGGVTQTPTPTQTSTPTPTEDDGIGKQSGNAAVTPGQTLSNPDNQR
jgi:hypothetical protein